MIFWNNNSDEIDASHYGYRATNVHCVQFYDNATTFTDVSGKPDVLESNRRSMTGVEFVASKFQLTLASKI